MFLLSRERFASIKRGQAFRATGLVFLCMAWARETERPGFSLLFLFFFLLQHNIARRSKGMGMIVLYKRDLLHLSCYIAGYGGWVVDCPIIIILFATWPQVYGFV